MTGEDPLSSLTLTQLVEKKIRDSIIEGLYRPGDRLRERDLSSDLGVSRLPVREALRNLEHAGFVESTAHRGASVRRMETKDISELFDLRMQLEPLAAFYAAEKYKNGEQSKSLHIAIGETLAAAKSGTKDEVLTTTATFHGSVLEASGHTLLCELMTPVIARTRWVMAMTLFRDPAKEAIEHQAIFEAVTRGNCELAKLRMAAHIESGREPSLHALTTI